MKVECFLDTNILLYAAAGKRDFPSKFRRATTLVEDSFGTSMQVVQEFFVNATRKPALGPMSVGQAVEWIDRIMWQPCVLIDLPLIRTAIGISERHRIDYWDGAILAAAERLGAETVYTEDLNHGQSYGAVRVINPFL